MSGKLTETEVRMQYAIRQFEASKLRAMMFHAKSLAYSAGNCPQDAMKCTETMGRHIHLMEESMDFIDECLRKQAGVDQKT